MDSNYGRAITALIDYVAALEDRYRTAIRMLADEVEAVSGTASTAHQAVELLVDEVERANEETANVNHALGSIGELFKQKADAGTLQSMGTMTMQTLRDTQKQLADLRKELKRIEEKEPAVEMRVQDDMIQYRGKDGWVDLISKKALQGPRGLRGLPGESKPGGAGGADESQPIGGAVESVNGKTGRVVLDIGDIPQLRDELDSRVEKEDGKGLISLAEAERLAGVTNYDDTALRQELITATAEIALLEAADQQFAEQLDEVAEQVANIENYDDTEVRAGIAANAENIAGLQTASHTHGNKAVLDSVAQTHIDLLEAIDDASAVDSQGITMRKPFNADGNAVTGIPEPTNPTDAVPYSRMNGIGESIPPQIESIEELDNINQNGIWRLRIPDDQVPVYAAGVDISYSSVYSERYSNVQGVQRLTNYNNLVIERWQRGGPWQPWENANPPMKEGVLYRTTERYMGKVVYTKLINMGAMANNGKISRTDSDLSGATHVISCNGTATNSSLSFTIPSRDVNGTGSACWAHTTGEIAVAANFNAAAYTARVVVKFTK